MPNLQIRSYEKELLDQDNIPFSDIRVTMSELNTINALLGGHSITRKGVQYFLSNYASVRPFTIAEIGCGGGDNLVAINKYITSHTQQRADLIGIDIKEECIHFAAQHVPADTVLICSDYRTTQWPSGKPHVIFSSLFCHHFTDEQMIEQLQWLKGNSQLGFFINDLHRHPVAYHSIRVLTKLFSKSYLVRNDGPLSVARSFRRADWVRLLEAAGIKNYTITWHWAFRFLVCVHHA
ncbi:MAG: methyltransferase domain-containing protein [Bacteroidota bacterium]